MVKIKKIYAIHFFNLNQQSFSSQATITLIVAYDFFCPNRGFVGLLERIKFGKTQNYWQEFGWSWGIGVKIGRKEASFFYPALSKAKTFRLFQEAGKQEKQPKKAYSIMFKKK